MTRDELWPKEISDNEEGLNKELNYLKEQKITIGQCFELYNLLGVDEEQELKDIKINV